jgi:hypothetical protein
MDGPDDENPPPGWLKNDQPAAPEEGLFVSDVELYRRLGVGRGQEGSRFDRFSTTASRQRTPYSEISAIGPPCAFLDDRYIHGRSTRNAAPSARQTWVVGQFDCGRMTGLNGSAGGAYLENEPRFVYAIDPRRIRLVAGLR